MTAERPLFKGPIPKESRREAQSLISHPPQLILVFDNWQGSQDSQRQRAIWVMRVRTAVAALVYHSDLYQSPGEKPTVGCFAGEHEISQVSGSSQVSELLESWGIPPEKIFTRTTTNTTRTDLMKLHAYIRAHQMANVAIVTTDDHRWRTSVEVINHFARGGRHRKATWVARIHVISPSSRILDKLKMFPQSTADYDLFARIRLVIAQGKGLTSGPRLREIGATLLSFVPNRRLRESIQQYAEGRYLPPDLARIKKVADFIYQCHRDEMAYKRGYARTD